MFAPIKALPQTGHTNEEEEIEGNSKRDIVDIRAKTTHWAMAV